jgi:transcriptional regulator with XRE-family HTH domain
MSQKEAADLAGISDGYLSRIESGRRAVNSRSLLEGLASALRVAPSELAQQAFPPPLADPVTAEVQTSILAVEAALSDLRLGTGGDSNRPWAAVAADMDHLKNTLIPTANYAAQGEAVPGLLHDLHQLYVTDPEHRVEVLQELVACYYGAAILTMNMGIRGLPTLAAFHARQVAEELDDPAWLGLSAWVGASTTGGTGRPRILKLAERGANELEPYLDDPRALQMYGQLHLSTSLSSAALNRHSKAADHLEEAGRIADRMGPTPGTGFGGLCFGPDNVGIWRVSVAVELGEPGKAREIAQTVHPERIDSVVRQAEFWADLGRGMAEERATRQEAVIALLRAEKLAPQRIRMHPLVREAVGDLIRRARRDAVGRELRGLGHRMGLGVG